MERLVQASFVFAAIVNLLPVLGVGSAARLEAAYGITIDQPSLEVMLRHRALLFGVVGVLLALAVTRRALRLPAAGAGWASMLSFIALVGLVEGAGSELQRLAAVDAVASVGLVAGLLIDRRRAAG